MPKLSQGPRLQLYGPDDKHGAWPRKRFRQYVYYIVWYEGRAKKEQSTGTGDRGEAEEALERFLRERRTSARKSTGPRDPDQVTVGEVLEIYGEEHGVTVAAPERIGYAFDALNRFWSEVKVSGINGPTCRAYLKHRKGEWARSEAARIAERQERIKARGGKGKPPAPARILSDDTVRRELGVLAAALDHCATEGHLTGAPAVWLPEKGASRDRHLNRQEVARLVRAARRSHRAGWHLPLFILIAFYTGARLDAILSLQWHPNTTGGWVDLGRGRIDFQGAARRTKKRRAAIPIPARLGRFLGYARRRTTQHVIEFEGKPIKSLRTSLGTAGRVAGLGTTFAHLLKHSAITYLVKSGVPLWDVAEWTGTSEETIRRTYGHHAPDYLNRVREALR